MCSCFLILLIFSGYRAFEGLVYAIAKVCGLRVVLFVTFSRVCPIAASASASRAWAVSSPK